MKKLFLTLSAFSFIYGIIMLFTNVTKTFFIMWIVFGLCSLIMYLLYKFKIIDKIPKFLRKATFVLSIICIVIVAFASFKIISGFRDYEDGDLDYVLVLGSHVTKYGPALATAYRLDKAYEYLNSNLKSKCILTGGKGDNEHDTEAVVMQRYLISRGVDSSRLILEDKASSTFENFSFSKQYMDVENDNIGIVTNNFHMYRALRIAKKQGYKNVYGMPAYSLPINLLSNIVRESIALIVYKLTGRI